MLTGAAHRGVVLKKEVGGSHKKWVEAIRSGWKLGVSTGTRAPVAVLLAGQ